MIIGNKRRMLKEEYGPYMNKRWAIYDNTGTLEVWFSDRAKALEWWSNNCDRPTYREQRDEERRNRLLGLTSDIVVEDDELPFM